MAKTGRQHARRMGELPAASHSTVDNSPVTLQQERKRRAKGASGPMREGRRPAIGRYAIIGIVRSALADISSI